MPENSSKLSSTNPVSPLPEIASEPICECDCVHCRAGNHRLCCKAAQCTPSPVPLPDIASDMTDEMEVKAIYPSAESFNIYPHVCGVFMHCDDESPIGIGLTESEAWEYVASRLHENTDYRMITPSPVPLGEPAKMKMVEVHHVSRSEAHERAIALIQKLRPVGCFADEDGIWGELDFLMICLKPTPSPLPLGEPAQTVCEHKSARLSDDQELFICNYCEQPCGRRLQLDQLKPLATKAVPIGEGEPDKDAEIAFLRKALIAAGRNAGCLLADEVSSNFLRHVPDEIASVLSRLRLQERPEDAAEDLYFIQDTRNYVGNSVMWWRPNGDGYTSDIDQAWKVTKEKAEQMHRYRSTDVAWSCAPIEAKAQRNFDHQLLRDIPPYTPPK